MSLVEINEEIAREESRRRLHSFLQTISPYLAEGYTWTTYTLKMEILGESKDVFSLLDITIPSRFKWLAAIEAEPRNTGLRVGIEFGAAPVWLDKHSMEGWIREMSGDLQPAVLARRTFEAVEIAIDHEAIDKARKALEEI